MWFVKIKSVQNWIPSWDRPILQFDCWSVCECVCMCVYVCVCVCARARVCFVSDYVLMVRTVVNRTVTQKDNYLILQFTLNLHFMLLLSTEHGLCRWEFSRKNFAFRNSLYEEWWSPWLTSHLQIMVYHSSQKLARGLTSETLYSQVPPPAKGRADRSVESRQRSGL